MMGTNAVGLSPQNLMHPVSAGERATSESLHEAKGPDASTSDGGRWTQGHPSDRSTRSIARSHSCSVVHGLVSTRRLAGPPGERLRGAIATVIRGRDRIPLLYEGPVRVRDSVGPRAHRRAVVEARQGMVRPVWRRETIAIDDVTHASETQGFGAPQGAPDRVAIDQHHEVAVSDDRRRGTARLAPSSDAGRAASAQDHDQHLGGQARERPQRGMRRLGIGPIASRSFRVARAHEFSFEKIVHPVSALLISCNLSRKTFVASSGRMDCFVCRMARLVLDTNLMPYPARRV
jgi:hypothetical protein